MPGLIVGLEAFVLAFTALGFLTSLFDFFWDFAIMMPS